MAVPAAGGGGERTRRGDPQRGVRDPLSLLLRPGEPGGLAGAPRPVPVRVSCRSACPGAGEALAVMPAATAKPCGSGDLASS